MPQFSPISLEDGTKFIKHTVGKDEVFVFGVKGGHVVSITIKSPDNHRGKKCEYQFHSHVRPASTENARL